ncbi:toxin Cry1Ac domain D-VI-related protein [Listeria booriae]|uniref:toxin Cry1Ac domain D-VI-related protein n=1 Tax=Listeria booriae TaxID=1552123 RepID=UPI001623C03B|nr:toxin Cry1Ac domain D-VI-related protein [Listeria booriae]MBC1800812.1 hypothetical protein [Listeria booriae]
MKNKKGYALFIAMLLMTIISIVLTGSPKASAAMTMEKELYTLENPTWMQKQGLSKGLGHDRQDLGIELPKGATIEIRQTNPNFKDNLSLQLLNDDSYTESSYNIGSAWVKVTATSSSVPFLSTTYTKEKPSVEYKVSDDAIELPIFNQGNNESMFFEKWDKNNASFSLIRNKYVQLLVPKIDKPYLKKMDSFSSIDGLLAYYDSMFEIYNELEGLSFTPQKATDKNIANRYFIKADAHGAGGGYYSNSWTAQSNTSIGAFWLRPGWGNLHEIAHGYQGSFMNDLTFDNREVWNNIFAYTAEKRIQGDNYKSNWNANEITFQQNVYTDLKPVNSWTLSDKLYMQVLMKDKAGDAAFTHFNQAYRTAANADTLSSNPLILDLITQYYGESSHYDFTPFIELVQGSMTTNQKVKNLQTGNKPVYPLASLVSGNNLTKARNDIALTSKWGLVSNDQLKKYQLVNTASIEFTSTDFAKIKGTTLQIKDGTNIIREIQITDSKMTIKDLPVGIYALNILKSDKQSYVLPANYLAVSDRENSIKVDLTFDAAITALSNLFVENDVANNVKLSIKQEDIDTAQAKINLATNPNKKAEMQKELQGVQELFNVRKFYKGWKMTLENGTRVIINMDDSKAGDYRYVLNRNGAWVGEYINGTSYYLSASRGVDYFNLTLGASYAIVDNDKFDLYVQKNGKNYLVDTFTVWPTYEPAKQAVDALFIDKDRTKGIQITTSEETIEAAAAKVDKVTDKDKKASLQQDIELAKELLEVSKVKQFYKGWELTQNGGVRVVLTMNDANAANYHYVLNRNNQWIGEYISGSSYYYLTPNRGADFFKLTLGASYSIVDNDKFDIYVYINGKNYLIDTFTVWPTYEPAKQAVDALFIDKDRTKGIQTTISEEAIEAAATKVDKVTDKDKKASLQKDIELAKELLELSKVKQFYKGWELTQNGGVRVVLTMNDTKAANYRYILNRNNQWIGEYISGSGYYLTPSRGADFFKLSLGASYPIVDNDKFDIYVYINGKNYLIDTFTVWPTYEPAKQAVDALFIDKDRTKGIQTTISQEAIEAAAAKVDKVTDKDKKASLQQDIELAKELLELSKVKQFYKGWELTQNGGVRVVLTMNDAKAANYHYVLNRNNQWIGEYISGSSYYYLTPNRGADFFKLSLGASYSIVKNDKFDVYVEINGKNYLIDTFIISM